MGFQSSFNQLLATASAGALGYKHIKGQMQANEIAANNQKMEALDKTQAYNEQARPYNDEVKTNDSELKLAEGKTILNRYREGKYAQRSGNLTADESQASYLGFQKALKAEQAEYSRLSKMREDLEARKAILGERKKLVEERNILAGITPKVESLSSAKNVTPSNFKERNDKLTKSFVEDMIKRGVK